MCIPILPGKKDKWREMMNSMNEAPLKAEIDKSREQAGVHERSFLQETPNGDFVILTVEGENPAEVSERLWRLRTSTLLSSHLTYMVST